MFAELRTSRVLAVLCLTLQVAACGGGGGGDASPVTPPPSSGNPSNPPPTNPPPTNPPPAAQAPQAPSGFTTVATSPNRIAITWVDNSSNEEGFRIERRETAGGTFALLTQTAAGATSFDDSTVAPRASYTYRAAAVNAAGASAWSNESSSITPALVAPTDAFAKTYFIASTHAHAAIQTLDGGYAITGRTTVVGDGNINAWVFKVDASGAIQWSRTYDDFVNLEYTSDIAQAHDGGFVVTSSDNHVNAGRITRLTSDGQIAWQRKFTWGSNSSTAAVVPTDDDADGVADDGYMVVGIAAGAMHLIKLNLDGTLAWTRADGLDARTPASVQQTPDGGYVVGGTYRASSDRRMYFISKHDSSGVVEWQKALGPSGIALSTPVAAWHTTDGYVLVGQADFISDAAFRRTAWIVKFDLDGDLVWQKRYDTGHDDEVRDAAADADGGILIGGVTEGDMWLLKLDADGDIVMQRRFGGPGAEAGNSVRFTSDGGYLLSGSATSFSNTTRAWLVKLPSSATLQFLPASLGQVVDTQAVAEDTQVALEPMNVTMSPATLTLAQPATLSSQVQDPVVATQSF